MLVPIITPLSIFTQDAAHWVHHITCWAHNIIIITSNIFEFMSDIFTICPPLRIWLLLFHFVLWIFCAGRHSLLLPEMSGKLTGLIYLNWQLMRFYNVIISFVHTSSGPPLSTIHPSPHGSITDWPPLSISCRAGSSSSSSSSFGSLLLLLVFILFSARRLLTCNDDFNHLLKGSNFLWPSAHHSDHQKQNHQQKRRQRVVGRWCNGVHFHGGTPSSVNHCNNNGIPEDWRMDRQSAPPTLLIQDSNARLPINIISSDHWRWMRGATYYCLIPFSVFTLVSGWSFVMRSSSTSVPT